MSKFACVNNYIDVDHLLMKNRKIVFANQKGGVGKSTLCILFANYLSWKKQEVCVIDTDLQKTIKMQRKKDMELYPTLEPPYEVQDFDVRGDAAVDGFGLGDRRLRALRLTG